MPSRRLLTLISFSTLESIETDQTSQCGSLKYSIAMQSAREAAQNSEHLGHQALTASNGNLYKILHGLTAANRVALLLHLIVIDMNARHVERS
jgi:hypothetical protein